jgi:hypothetical protein
MRVPRLADAADAERRALLVQTSDPRADGSQRVGSRAGPEGALNEPEADVR